MAKYGKFDPKNKKQQKDKYQNANKKNTFKGSSKQRFSNKLPDATLRVIEDNLDLFIENK